MHHRGALLLTNDEGNNTAAVVRDALKHPRLREANYLLLAADLQAIPMERRPNPVPGKDAIIEMEPLTPTGTEPFSLRHRPAVSRRPRPWSPLMLARQRLLRRAPPSATAGHWSPATPAAACRCWRRSPAHTAHELRNCRLPDARRSSATT